MPRLLWWCAGVIAAALSVPLLFYYSQGPSMQSEYRAALFGTTTAFIRFLQPLSTQEAAVALSGKVTTDPPGIHIMDGCEEIFGRDGEWRALGISCGSRGSYSVKGNQVTIGHDEQTTVFYLFKDRRDRLYKADPESMERGFAFRYYLAACHPDDRLC